MNKTNLQGKIRKTRGRLKGRWAKLTSDDVGQLEAKFDEMLGLFQERYGYTQEQASRELTNFFGSYTRTRNKVLPWRSSGSRSPWLVGGVVLGLILAVRVVARLMSADTVRNSEDA